MIENNRVKKPLHWYIATWFGCGLSPVISGTAGSLGALPFAYIIQNYFGNFALFIASLLIFAIGTWASNQYLAHMQATRGPKPLDPREIVVDEVAGQWLILSALFPTWQSYLVGFLLFRIFDIIKPWPVSLADRKIHGGFGVMFDDMLAAGYPIVIGMLIVGETLAFGSYNLIKPVVNFLGGAYVH